MHKTPLKIFGIILGVITIILAICVFDMSVGSYEGTYSYGGDAYTGIQNAAAQTANNVKYVGEMLRFALGSQMLVTGLAMLLGSLCIRTKEKVRIPAPVQAPPVPVPPAPKTYAAPSSGGYTPPAATAPHGWRCAKCGTINEADARFCYSCGAPRG